MKYFKLLNKLSNILFIPTLILAVCLVVFREPLNTFRYVQLLRYLLILLGIILIVGALVKNKDEKDK